jgi:hypothetical protein
MRALVVYESLYGNTAQVGEAIAASLREHGIEVESGLVQDVAPAAATEADVLVAGGPTHVHGMTRGTTRKTAAADEKNAYPTPTLAPGLREWLQQVEPGAGRWAAAFDTRIDKPALLTGSAAKGIARKLSRGGFRLAVEPECFLVTTENRLVEGEVERARGWATELRDRMTVTAAAR